MFPHQIVIDMPVERTRVNVQFSELKVNASIDIARFSLKEHANIPIEELPD